MARYLLDTDAVIDYLKGFESSVSFIQGLHGQGDLLCLCGVVIAEVFAGLRPSDRDKAGMFLDACYFLATSAETARQAGEWRYSYHRRGVALATTDALVAATAVEHKAALVTANVDHYPMDEVSVLPLPRMQR